MADCEPSVADVRKFISVNGGKVTNHDLVKHFKKFLNDPESQGEARAKFKDMVNVVATIKQEDGVKYLVLKQSHAEKKRIRSNNLVSPSVDSNGFHQGTQDGDQPMDSSNSCVSSTEGSNIPFQDIRVSQPNSLQVKGPWSSDLPPGHTPQPPPRRKNSTRGKENTGTKFEESMKQLSEEKDSQDSPRQEEIKEIVSPGSVKEKAQKLNRMASEVDLSQKGTSNGTTHGSVRRREHKTDKNADDDDASSVSTLDPRRKEWILNSARADYHALARMLREEPRLANCKDSNAYTALHWSAKHGNLDVIKLIAGTYKIDSNSRTSGGYTPLHLAAIFGHEEIMEVLINTYGADPMIRDYTGKRPFQYLPHLQEQRFLSLFPAMKMNAKASGTRSDKEVGFHRIGSLNSKVKKTSAMFSGNKALTRMKSWGSADNIQDRNLMPPPKFFPKRKKTRKHMEYFGTDSAKGRSGDSDSDSTPGMSTV